MALYKGDVRLTGVGGGAAVWGGITGTLSNQTDLQTALNGINQFTATDGGVKVFDLPDETDSITNALAWQTSGGQVVFRDTFNLEGDMTDHLFYVSRWNTTAREVTAVMDGGGGTVEKVITYDANGIVTNVDTNSYYTGTAKYGLEDEYDAIVDASGNGDYTTIGAAVDANKRKIFVKNGTYNETQGHLINMAATDELIITGESKSGVIVNVTLTEVQSPWSEYYNYPSFLFVDMYSTTKGSVDIRKLTFNGTVNTTQADANFLRVRTDYNSGTHYNDFYVEDCRFFVTNSGSTRARFDIISKADSCQYPIGTQDVYNCTITVTSDTATLGYGTNSDATRDEMTIFKNCDFISKANNGNIGRLSLRNGYDCNVKFLTTGMGGIEFSGNNIENCEIDAGANVSQSVPISISLDNMRNCELESRHVGAYSPTRIGVSSIIPEWQANTSYSVGTQVLRESTFYQCNTAHTSASDWYTNNENEKWDTVATIFVNNTTGSTIKTGETIELGGTIRGNTFDLSFGPGDVLVPNHCIMEGNFFPDDSYSRNMYINEHSVINGNVFGGRTYGNGMGIRYVSTKTNVITNNINYSTSLISKIGNGSSGVVANNASWS